MNGRSRGSHPEHVEDALAFFEGAVRGLVNRLRGTTGQGPQPPRAGQLSDPRRQARRASQASLRRALPLVEALEAKWADDPDIAHERVVVLIKQAVAVEQAGRIDESIGVYLKAIERADRAARLGPASYTTGEDLAWAKSNLGTLLYNSGRFERAEPHFSEAVRIRRELLGPHPDRPDSTLRLAEYLDHLGVTLMKRGQVARADAHFAEAVKLLDSLVHSQFDKHAWWLSLSRADLNWGTNDLSDGRIDRASDRAVSGRAQVGRSRTPHRPRLSPRRGSSREI